MLYGDIPEFKGDVPKKPSDDKYTYAFAGWTPEIVPVTANATYTAFYEATPIDEPVKGTLMFDFDGGTLDGKTSLTIVADVGDVITIPAAPTKDGYEFKYWKGSEYYPGDKYTVEGDHAFKAVWEPKAATKGSSAKSGSAKTGDAIPVAIIAVVAAIAAAALVIARRKIA